MYIESFRDLRISWYYTFSTVSLFFRIDKAQGQLQKAKTVGILPNRFETYAYKPKKKEVTVLFGLKHKGSCKRQKL
jgi:hypothetical protein